MYRILLLLALAYGPLSGQAYAKDVSAQQVGVEYARGNLEKAEATHKRNQQDLADSEKRLAEMQKRVAEDRKKTDTSKRDVDEAKAKHERAQKLLEQAWQR